MEKTANKSQHFIYKITKNQTNIVGIIIKGKYTLFNKQTYFQNNTEVIEINKSGTQLNNELSINKKIKKLKYR